MSGVNGQEFGHFTYKNRDYDLKQFDVNHNGKLEKSEVDALLERLAQETGEDILELSNIVNSHDINKDGNLDINEMNRWQIEDGINAKVSAFDATISADFIGDLAQYQSRARADVRAFAQQFINNTLINGNVNVQTVLSQFETALNTQYTTVIKPEYEQLRDEANREVLISRITDNVIEYLLTNRPDMTDTQIEKLGDWIFAEATRLVDSSTNLTEAQILQQIIDKLEETPAQMVNDEVFTDWEEYSAAVEQAGVYIDQSELANLKSKAKALMAYAIAHGIKLQQNGHNINASTMNNLIEREFGGSSGGHKLITWINNIVDAIKDVSNLTYADLIAYGAQDLTLDIDTCTIGDIPKLDTELMQSESRVIIEKVMRDKGITSSSYDAQTRHLFGEALSTFADNFIASYKGTSISAFRENLEAALTTYFDCPIAQENKDKFGQYKTDIANIDLTNPDENDINDLKAIIKEMMQTAGEAGIKLIGADGKTLNLNTVDITIDNIETIKAALLELCEEIRDLANTTLADIIANNQNKDWTVRIQVDLVNGTASLHETPIDPVHLDTPENQEILDDVIDDLLTDISSSNKTIIAKRLKKYAALIISEYTGKDKDGNDIDLATWLSQKLTILRDKPTAAIFNYLNEKYPLQDYSAYDGNCTETEWKELTDRLEGMLKTYKALLGVEFYDARGNNTNANKILENFDRTTNPGELYDLLESIQRTLCTPLEVYVPGPASTGGGHYAYKSMSTILDMYPSGVIPVVIDGTRVYVDPLANLELEGDDYDISCSTLWKSNKITLPSAGTYDLNNMQDGTIFKKIAKVGKIFYNEAKKTMGDSVADAAYKSFINYYWAICEKINDLIDFETKKVYDSGSTGTNEWNYKPVTGSSIFGDNGETIQYKQINSNGDSTTVSGSTNDSGIKVRKKGGYFQWDLSVDAVMMRAKFSQFLAAAM